MREQPLPERISFICGFLQSKSWCREKRLPLLGAPHPCGRSVWGLVTPPAASAARGGGGKDNSHWKSLLEPGLRANEVQRVKGRVLVGATCPGAGVGGVCISHLVPGLKLLKSRWKT